MTKNVKKLKPVNRKVKTTGVKPVKVKCEAKPEKVKCEAKPEKVKCEAKPAKVKSKVKPAKVKSKVKNGKLKYEKWNVSPVILDRAVDGIMSLSMRLSKLRGKYASNKMVDGLEQITLKIFKDLSVAVNPE